MRRGGACSFCHLATKFSVRRICALLPLPVELSVSKPGALKSFAPFPQLCDAPYQLKILHTRTY